MDMTASGVLIVCTLLCNPFWSFPSDEDLPPLPQLNAQEVINFYQDPRVFRNEREVVSWLFAPDQDELIIGGTGPSLIAYDLGEGLDDANRDFIDFVSSQVFGSVGSIATGRSRHQKIRQPILADVFILPDQDRDDWDAAIEQARISAMTVAAERNLTDAPPDLLIAHQRLGCILFQWTNEDGEIIGSIGAYTPSDHSTRRRASTPSPAAHCAMVVYLAHVGIRGGFDQPLSRMTFYSEHHGHAMASTTTFSLLMNLLYLTELEPGMTRSEVLQILVGE